MLELRKQRVRTCAGLAVLALVAVAAWAEKSSGLTEGMKDADEAAKALQASDARPGRDTVRQAETLGGMYEDMIAFWRARRAPDAVKWSEQGKAAAVQLAAAASAGDAAKSSAAFNRLSETCGACHQVYAKTLPDGSMRIK